MRKLFFLFVFAFCVAGNARAQLNRISGDLRYDNLAQTPMAGVPVFLKTLLGNSVASDTTDSSGAYSLAGFANGNYLLETAVLQDWGGVNSTDARGLEQSQHGCNELYGFHGRAGRHSVQWRGLQPRW